MAKNKQDILEIINKVKKDKSKELSLKGMDLTAFPSEVLELDWISHLDLSQNNLSEIPEEIKYLHNLTILNVSNNLISFIPKEIRTLPKLEFLDFSNTPINNIPKEIGGLSNLEYLNISNTKIENIPYEISFLKKLKYLGVENNPLKNPPYEITSQGLDVIMRYLLELDHSSKIETINEAKLLILGDAGAGKTTLAKKLIDPQAVLPNESEITKGIDVNQLVFSTTEGKEFTLNIWDFGGQEIYHATHQFFLTKRSIYLLVHNARRSSETSLKYWLQTIELYGNGSPILIIQNEQGDQFEEIDIGSIKARFPAVKEIYRSNFSTNRGIGKITKAIKFYAQELPHIGDELPQAWVKIRRRIQELAINNNYIDKREYFDVCKEYGLKSRVEFLLLSHYLHDIGVFLHFQDDPLLKKIIIVNPFWVTAAVYEILNDDIVREHNGLFSRDDLNRIWDEDKYIGVLDELLALMMKFELCYCLPDTNEEFIVPQLLSNSSPGYEWEEQGNLFFKLSYDFLPKGLLTKFIVRMSRYIDSDLVWRGGVILKRENTKGEIVKSYEGNEIKIRISGLNKKEFLTIIREDFQIINESYSGLIVKELVPCNCILCKENSNPNYYRYDNLIKRQSLNKMKVECDRSFNLVDISSLLMGIDVDKNRIVGSGIEVAGNVHIGDRFLFDEKFDVFISYNHEDKIKVTEIAQQLKEEGLKVWLDIWEITAGDSITKSLERAIENSDSLLICLGEKPLSKMQITEMDRARENNKKVIPLIISSDLDETQISSSISNYSYVRLDDMDSDPINKIVLGIRGQASSKLLSQFKINEIKNLIAKGKINEVFEKFKKLINYNDEVYDILIVLMSRYFRLEESLDNGVIAYADLEIERAKIYSDLLDLVNGLGRSTISNQLVELESKVKDNPDDINTWKEFAKLYQQLGHNEKAEKSIIKVEALQEAIDFKRNKLSPITIEKLEVKNITFFDDFEWELQPNINILLGKNGYGKSQLLRALVGILYNNHEKTKDFFKSRKTSAEITISSVQSEELKKITREALIFKESFGKIPILAIPDLRFINKSEKTIKRSEDDKNDIVQDGAYHFLYQKPYEASIQNFLYGLCNDYLENNKKFNTELFELIADVFKFLTGEEFKFHEIRRKGSVGFEMEVITESNYDNPLPIQKVSQGTLSILSIVGLIYCFLKESSSGTEQKEISKQKAIVIIDEIDAHLHPSWQQKIVSLLRKYFPNVQFICTAHSPLIVAGCKEEEVSVLRKSEEGFSVEQFSEDFIGYNAEELYRKVFEIEGVDEIYKYYTAMIPLENNLKKELEKLEGDKENLDSNEELRLNELYDILHYIGKAKNKSADRNKLSSLEIENWELKLELRRLKNKMK